MRRAARRAIRTTRAARAAVLIRHRLRTKSKSRARSRWRSAGGGRGGHGESRCSRLSSSSSSSSRSWSIWRSTTRSFFLSFFLAPRVQRREKYLFHLFWTSSPLGFYLLSNRLSTHPLEPTSPSRRAHPPHRAHHTAHRHTANQNTPTPIPRSTHKLRVRLALLDPALGRIFFSLQCTTTAAAAAAAVSRTLHNTAILVPRLRVPRPARLATPSPPPRPVSPACVHNPHNV